MKYANGKQNDFRVRVRVRVRNRCGESISEGTLPSSLKSEERGRRKSLFILSLNKGSISTCDWASCLDYLE